MDAPDESTEARPKALPGPPAGRSWAIALSAALIAGLASWAIAERLHRDFVAIGAPKDEPGKEERLERAIREESVITRRNSVVTYGVLGAALGFGLGLGGGLARGLSRRAPALALAGAIAGGAAGVATTYGLVPVYQRIRQDASRRMEPGEIQAPLLSRVGLWSPLGLVGGLALGLGMGGPRRPIRAAVGGLLGAALAGVAFELAAPLTLPAGMADGPVAERPSVRLAADLDLSLLVAAGAVATALHVAPRRPARTDPATASGDSVQPSTP